MKVKNIMTFLMQFSLGIIILIVFEGILTLGDAFNFENYSIVGWVFQSCVLVIVFYLSSVDYDDANDNRYLLWED